MRISLGIGIGSISRSQPVTTINASVTSGAPSVTSSLRGSGGVALYLNPRALTPGALTTYTDSSGNGRNFTAAGGKEPTAEAAGGVNSTPDVRFPASKVMSLAGSAFAALTAADIWSVQKFDAAGASVGGSNCPWQLGVGAGGQEVWTYVDNQIYAGPGSTARKVCGDPTQDMTLWHVARAISTSNEFTLKVGTQALFTTATNTVGFAATCYLGGLDATPSAYMLGNNARLVIFDHKLSAAEETSFRAGLIADLGAVPGL